MYIDPITILPIVLYDCKTRYLTAKDDRKYTAQEVIWT